MKPTNIIGLKLSLGSDIMDGMIAIDTSYVPSASEEDVLPETLSPPIKSRWVGKETESALNPAEQRKAVVLASEMSGVMAERSMGIFLQCFDHCMWKSREQKWVIQRTRDSEQHMVVRGRAVPMPFFPLPSFCFLEEQRHGRGRTWGKLSGVEQDIWSETKYLHSLNGELRFKSGEPFTSLKWSLLPCTLSLAATYPQAALNL